MKDERLFFENSVCNNPCNICASVLFQKINMTGWTLNLNAGGEKIQSFKCKNTSICCYRFWFFVEATCISCAYLDVWDRPEVTYSVRTTNVCFFKISEGSYRSSVNQVGALLKFQGRSTSRWNHFETKLKRFCWELFVLGRLTNYHCIFTCNKAKSSNQSTIIAILYIIVYNYELGNLQLCNGITTL